MHAYIHTHIHTYIHTCIQTYPLLFHTPPSRWALYVMCGVVLLQTLLCWHSRIMSPPCPWNSLGHMAWRKQTHHHCIPWFSHTPPYVWALCFICVVVFLQIVLCWHSRKFIYCSNLHAIHYAMDWREQSHHVCIPWLFHTPPSIWALSFICVLVLLQTFLCWHSMNLQR